ncbi:Hsp70 protein [Amycolatopsis marina]|uniref:Hsp70 protein n=1 Tax=Amycolatopsis marina TaxID=490629 RepID=A0A1I1AHV7_9PSEU|nr:Hsp70 family protein [Amycolatopsis marina]SFB37537.1 Hsp70 protein [Amycolatopsis marina]
MRILSVDLGTSNTVAVLSAHGRPSRVVEVDGSATMPSAVFAEEDGTLMVGRDAERRARLDPTRFEPNPKRRVDEQTLLLGDDVVPVTEALAAVLRRVFEETSRQLGGDHPDEVRLTHPAQWGPVRRNVLLSAARLAGANGGLSLVPEPVAAAAHFASFPGKGLAQGQALAVYDLGAGTFDVAVVGALGPERSGFAVLAEDGLPDLGGLDVDQALLVHVGREVSHRDPQRWQRLLRPESTADRRTRRALQEDVRAAKEALSRHPQTEVPMPEPFADVLVTRGELEALVRPAMLRSVELVSRTLRSAGVSPGNLGGIYLVGGSSRLPLVATMIAEKLGVVPTSLDQPETAVAFGAHHVSADGLSMRTQNVEGQVAASGAPARYQQGPPGPQVTPPAQPQGPYGAQGHYGSQGSQGSQGAGQAFPHSGPQPAPTQQQAQGAAFPTYPAAQQSGSGRSKGKTLIGVAAVLVVLVAAGATYLLTRSPSVQTHTAQECQQPGEVDESGFTGCLRQLAGSVADDNGCTPGMGTGPAAAADQESLGVSVTCSTPGLAGAQVTYLHGGSAEDLERYTNGLLNRTGGADVVRADWRGNALDGSYSAAGGRDSSVLVFRVQDRPLAGFIYQVNSTGQESATAPAALADYFEQHIQPGE